jgi:hypothetical protein
MPTDNSGLAAKVEIRRRLLDSLEEPSVLDCFAGEGHLAAACYEGLKYLGLDKRGLGADLRVDNIRFLRSAGLEEYNLFDLDAWGSPWYQFFIIMTRRAFAPGELVAFALTDGLDFTMKMSDTESGIKALLGIPQRMKVPNLDRHANFIRSYIVAKGCERAGCEIAAKHYAENDRGNVSYMGLLLKGRISQKSA